MSAQPNSAAPPEPVAQQPSPEDRLMSSERAQQITSAVEQLPDRQRLVFTLCHISEHTTSEVSQALGLSEATVRVHLFRAVRKLRKLLDRPRAASAPAADPPVLNPEKSTA
jgi:RNA polymerase sigma-70 factor (ECF subfamily)